MQSINFNTGYKTYSINGDENNVICVNVTDVNILKRFEETQKIIEDIDKIFVDKNNPTPGELYTADQKIREALNYAFGSDICTPAFGAANCLSPVSNGKTLFEAFTDAFLPVIKRDIESAMNASRIHLEQKTDKYVIKPRISEAHPTVPDISSLTPEQKDALLMEYMRQ